VLLEAKIDGSDWIINGTKTYVPNTGIDETDFFIVLCRTDTETEVPGTGLSMILVKNRQPGLSIDPPLKRLGERLTPMVNFCRYH